MSAVNKCHKTRISTVLEYRPGAHVWCRNGCQLQQDVEGHTCRSWSCCRKWCWSLGHSDPRRGRQAPESLN